MSLPIPNLDDRNFEDLLNEARALIPIYSKDWTNHNPSDPGITLLELFAWLTEIMIYRINQVPDANYRKYLELVLGAQLQLKEEDPLEVGIRQALEELTHRYRAITTDDYEFLANECMKLEFMKTGAGGLKSRAIAMNNCDLEFNTPDNIKLGHVSVIIIPENPEFLPPAQLKSSVKKYLDPRRLITTRVHVTSPFYRKFTLEIAAVLKENTPEQAVRDEVTGKVRLYFNPLEGGPDEKGWPLGRGLYRSEVFRLVEGISGIDHVNQVIIRDEKGVPVSFINLAAHELVFLKADPIINFGKV